MDSRLLWLALGAFAGSVESALVVAVMPAIAAETGVTIAEAGLLVFVYSIAYGFGTPILASILGGVDRRRVVAGAELLFGIAVIAVGSLPGFVAILIARTALAIGAGTFTSTAQSTAVAIAAPGQRGRAVSTVVMGGTIAVAFGAPLAALVANLYGWRVAYVGLGLIAVLASVIMWWRLPHDLHGDQRTLRERLSVIGVKGVPMTLLSSGLIVLATFMLMIYLAPITTDAVGLDSSRMPIVLFAYGIGALLGNYGCGWLVDRLGARSTMSLVIVALILLLAALPLVPMAPYASREPVFLAYILCFGALTWGFFPGQLLRLASLAPASVPLVASLNLTASNVGGAVASLSGGVALQEWGLVGIGCGGAAIAVLALVITLMVREPAA